ncbi:MAG: ParA family protein [Hamadaea sp.]|nr:ParA family protein [Hamadaea sp.]
MPRVVSVINYKGGVGKTTLTANIGAELAHRGRRILLIDVDPQASLTFCFYTAAQWESDIQDVGSALQWIGPLLGGGEPEPLERFVRTPSRVNEVVSANDGRLDLVASHLGLIDADQDLATELGGSRAQVRSPNFLRVHRVIADALATPAFADYDVVVIDCPPNFGMMTRAAIVASEWILVPARPDYLSTLGIDYLRGRLSELVDDHNRAAALAGRPAADIAPEILGVVVNMVQYAGAQPILAHQEAIRGLDALEIKVFEQRIRQSNTLFGGAGESLPAVLAPNGNAAVQYELQQLASEFSARLRT